MKSIASVFVMISAGTVLTGCSTFHTTTTREVPERWSFAFDARPWQLGYQAANGQQTIREYVLSGQPVQNWSELVTSQYLAGKVSPRAVFEQFRHDISRGCPSLRLSVIEESADRILFEWQ